MRILDSRLQLEKEYGRECSLREHCSLLGRTLYLIGGEGHLSNRQNTRDGEVVAWENAADWLEVAASVQRVEVDTSYLDDSVEFCGTAYDYQRARSLGFSALVTELTVFNFAWGTFETVTKLIDPPNVPKKVKPGRTGMVDQVLYYLKTSYEPRSPVPFYRETVEALSIAINDDQPQLLEKYRLEDHVSLSGIGLSVVRRIRNKFAHGAAYMPEPDEYWSSGALDAKVVEVSTRILLYTIQFLLTAHLGQTSFDLQVRRDEYGESLSEDVHFVLRSLHVKHQRPNESQLLLFDT
jgi:hypothetical protein